MGPFEKTLYVFIFSVFAFLFITSMDNIGKTIGFDEMKYAGIAMLFGITSLKILMVEDGNKEEE